MESLENKEILADFTHKEEKSAIDTLASVIKSACQRIVAQAGFDRTVAGIIVSSNADGSCAVRLEGGEYTLPNTTFSSLPKGTPVWVTIPCNKLRNAYISALRGTSTIKKFGSAMFHKGDSYSFNRVVDGLLTTGATDITFDIPVGKVIANDVGSSPASVTISYIVIRHSDGGYIVPWDNTVVPSGWTMSTKAINRDSGAVRITYKTGTAVDFTNNCPLSIEVKGTIKF